jgi:hypothetical protein
LKNGTFMLVEYAFCACSVSSMKPTSSAAMICSPNFCFTVSP